MPLARVDGKKTVTKEAEYLAAISIERRGDGIEEGVERLDVAFAANCLGQPGRAAHVGHDQRGPDGVAVPALDLPPEHTLAGVAAELYLGAARGVGKQLKYADRTGVPIALLYGSDEKAAGKVTLKDLGAGRARAEGIEGREEWLEKRPGQREAERSDLVAAVLGMLAAIEESGG